MADLKSNAERALEWVESRSDGAWLEERVDRLAPALTALLDAAAADAVAAERKRRRAELKRLRKALTTLRGWDMLDYAADGAWARQVIDVALSESAEADDEDA